MSVGNALCWTDDVMEQSELLDVSMFSGCCLYRGPWKIRTWRRWNRLLPFQNHSLVVTDLTSETGGPIVQANSSLDEFEQDVLKGKREQTPDRNIPASYFRDLSTQLYIKGHHHPSAEFMYISTYISFSVKQRVGHRHLSP